MTTPMAWVLLLLCAGTTAAANILLRVGLILGGVFPSEMSRLPFWFFRMLLQPAFSMGFILYFLAALIWFKVLASEPLSLAYPLLVSITFLLVTTGSMVFFKEAMPPLKIIGLVVILTGIFIVSKA